METSKYCVKSEDSPGVIVESKESEESDQHVSVDDAWSMRP